MLGFSIAIKVSLSSKLQEVSRQPFLSTSPPEQDAQSSTSNNFSRV